MSNINARGGRLFFDFRYQRKRCREYTKLDDTPANRKRTQCVLDRIEAEITLGTFEYATYFPGSRNAEKFAARAIDATLTVDSPIYKVFAETWFTENEPLWRRSHRATAGSTLDRHLVPWFGERPVASSSTRASPPASQRAR